MPARTGKGKRVSELFFTRCPTNADVYVCRCGTKRKRTGSSYQNLTSHVQTAHPNYMDLIECDEKLTQAQLDKYFTTAKSKHLYGWIDFVVNGLLPFHYVEKLIIRKHLKHEPPSLDAFMKYLQLLTEHVEMKIKNLLHSKLALVFDGWTVGSTHYLAVFASFHASNDDGYDARLLTLSPMGDECSLNAQEHYEFLTFVLNLYQKSWANVVCLVGDNMNTNKSIANILGRPLIGCASHRLNLAVKDVLNEEEELLQKIHTIMIKLRGLLLGAKLKKLTNLTPKLRNVTRWSSSYQMVQRYVELREYLALLESDEVDALSLTPAENRRADALLLQLKPLESVNKVLQTNSTTVSDARALFDAVIQKYSDTTNRLSSSAGIVHSPDFENAVVKIQRNNSSALSREESVSVSSLLIEEDQVQDFEEEGLSFAMRALKRQRCMNERTKRRYCDTRFLLASSNLCERFFSRAGFALSDRRRGINPVNLEALIFLHFNNDLWCHADVNKLTSL